MGYKQTKGTSNTLNSEYTTSGDLYGYLLADNSDDSTSVGEIPAYGSNRWSHEGFLNTVPQITDPYTSIEENPDGDPVYDVQAVDSSFYVGYPYLDDNQPYIDISAIEPDNAENGEFSLSIGYTLAGPLSLGTALVSYESPSVRDDDYISTEWTFQHSLGTQIDEGFGTSQTDAMGVRYDVDAQGTKGSYTIENNQMHGWEVIEYSGYGSQPAYTNTEPIVFYSNVEIV